MNTEVLPRPWHLHSGSDRRCYILDGPVKEDEPFRGQVICVSSTVPNREAHIKHILRAVNSHDELLDALKEVLRHCVTAGGFPDKGKGRTEAQQFAFDAANAAIAKAEGRE
jgi:hypothetical protein